MTIEGMWALYFGDAEEEARTNSGIIVLDSQRLMGGGSAIAYLGTYTVDGMHLVATARTWAYKSTIEARSAFGREGKIDVHVRFEGIIDDEKGSIVGGIWEEGNPASILSAIFRHITALPE